MFTKPGKCVLMVETRSKIVTQNCGVVNKSPAFDATHMAFLLLESLYVNKTINRRTYQNVLRKKSDYRQNRIEEAVN